jgi:hypothetical protein
MRISEEVPPPLALLSKSPSVVHCSTIRQID